MKFLCDNCKAKYQLSDDKVAGRTVRMKCRKCGHLIEVGSQATGHLAGLAAVGAAESVPPEEVPSSPASTTVRPLGARPPPPPPPRRSQAHTTIGHPKAPPPPPKPPPPRPSSLKGAAPPKATPASPKSTGLAGAFSKAVAGAPSGERAPSDSTQSALASGEQAEQWYVGIGGVPVGPIPRAEVRAKAAEGAVTLDSLVWREGLAEWGPLRSHPELAAIVSDALAAERPPPAPSPAVSPSSHSPAALRSAGPAARPAPPPPRSSVPRSNVVPIASRLATAAKLDEPRATPFTGPQPVSPEPEPVEDGPDEEEDDVTMVATAALSLPVATPPTAAPAIATPPAAAPTPPAAAPSAPFEHGDSIVAPAPKRRRRRAHPAAWAVVALGGVLGGIFLGLSLAGKPKPEVQVVTVAQPVATPDIPPPPAAEPTSTSTTIDTVAVKPVAGGGSTGSTTTKASGEAKGSAPAAAAQPAGGAGPATGLAGLSGLVGGPSVKPPTGASPSGGGGSLAQADIERVVQSHRAFVKRQCWESALAGKSPSAPSSARVSVSLTIASDGRVTAASASGGDGYPSLASCVQNQVRSWRFPPSDGASVSVPFVFAAQ